ncbi:DUF885 domain-containing protein [Marinihelvus fidelis]|uniref:DUF885 domain-containing protein n=1 Tax=Marinihelvus fidelis TaxID=2613842 RepID=A0A5N0TGD6_9GAMM|nr:DUF885 domain-containing protein [Marinihelvus fidelis]KAA9134110.1 DUF885 domain-containing protein [Marinihelvus fidelis]
MTYHSTRLLLISGLTLVALTACQKDAAETESAGASSNTAELAPATEVVETAPAPSETERLNAWFDERYEEQLQRSPFMLTFLGRKERYDELDDYSIEAVQDEVAWLQGTVEELGANFDYDALSPLAQESWDLWVFQAEAAAQDLRFFYQDYLFGELGGPEDQLPTFLINFHKVDTEADMRAYIQRLREGGRAMGQVLEIGQASAGMGVRPPKFAFEVALKRASNVVDGGPFSGEEDSPVLADARRKIDSLASAGEIDAPTADALMLEVENAMNEAFGPAYTAYIEWLQAEMANADEVARGVAALPDGVDYYNHQLSVYTTLDMTADEVHELGLSEVARIKGEMEAIREQVGFEGDLEAFFEFIRTDPRFYYPNTDEGREAYLGDTRAYLAEIDQKLPEWFGLLPKAGLEVKRVEAFREVDGGAQHYMPGTPDGSRPGVYYVHMSDMSAYSKTDMETVAYHEASPGHHMQVSIALELEGVPQFRTQARFSVYSEGWALYAEALSKEMGQFKDPYMDFGRLTAEMWRAIRLVVDTGLHAKGWSQEQAVQFFFDNSAIPEGAVRSEVRRYLTMPGQAVSYKIGMLKIQELRAMAEAELGDAFDIRGFHDTVLGGGALPMPLLEARVQRWVDSQGG